MQTQAINPGISPFFRPSSGKGEKEPKIIRKRGAARKKAAPAVLGRFHSVVFSGKPAINIILEKDKGKVLSDLYLAYCNYYGLINNTSDFEVLPEGQSNYESYQWLRNEFSKLVTDDCQYQVDQDNSGNYCFVIYQECDWEDQLHIFELKSIVSHLQTENKDLLHVFNAFIKMFTKITGIDLWFQGEITYALEFLDDNILNLTDEMEGVSNPEDKKYLKDHIKDFQDCLDIYHSGAAFESELAIKNSCEWFPEELIEEIKSLESDSILIEWMIKGCELCIDGKNIGMYVYNPDEGMQYDGEGLHFEQQFAIVWDDSDHATEELCSMIDSSANEGVDVPFTCVYVSKNSKEVFKPDTWLPKIDNFFECAAEIVRKIYNNEQTNSTTTE